MHHEMLRARARQRASMGLEKESESESESDPGSAQTEDFDDTIEMLEWWYTKKPKVEIRRPVHRRLLQVREELDQERAGWPTKVISAIPPCQHSKLRTRARVTRDPYVKR